ncbi:hypothetical protein Paz_26 [Xylella phage Paz]|uniref:Uncharacterized protein n=1 Tax=Xylella phage Paz TaxID=1415145 RepID=V5Q7Q6_9CAUD|nr:hypothetical protein Paz_26 [Xylella phage Paz]AHB12123.1 hypothetical protein Paz_26 [Xylella phage Paz]
MIDVTVVNRPEAQMVRILIDVPFEQYASALYPNQVLRDGVNDAMDIVLAEAQHNRR